MREHDRLESGWVLDAARVSIKDTRETLVTPRIQTYFNLCPRAFSEVILAGMEIIKVRKLQSDLTFA